MKKYIYAIPALLMMVLTGCNAEEGTEPGTDSTPGVVVYSYSPDASKKLNADNDITIRFATNSAAREISYLIEKEEAVQSYLASNGEEAYAAKVASEGTKITVSGAEQTDIDVTGLYGPYIISAVATNGTNHGKRSSVTFTGLDWSDVVNGTFYPEQSFLKTPVMCTLQVCTTDDTLFRLKDVFGEGYSMKIQLLDITGTDSEGKYTYARIPRCDTPYMITLSDGSKEQLWIQDVGYWQGSANWVTSNGYESGMYEDYSCFFMAAWMAGTRGCLAYNDNSCFIPD